MIATTNAFHFLVLYLSLLYSLHSFVPGRNRMFSEFSGGCSSSSSLLLLSHTPPSPSGQYLERMIERKKIEVNQLLRKHDKPDDPIFMRMTYMASENKYNVTRFVPLFSHTHHSHSCPYIRTHNIRYMVSKQQFVVTIAVLLLDF